MLVNSFIWALVWANLIGILAQVDIPNEVWGQYPLILIGVALVGWLARYWVQNEKEWRDFCNKQVAEKESSNLRVIQLVQANHENQLKILLDNQSEQLRLQRTGLKEAFDAELERVLDALSTGYYEQRPSPQQPQKRARKADET